MTWTICFKVLKSMTIAAAAALPFLGGSSSFWTGAAAILGVPLAKQVVEEVYDDPAGAGQAALYALGYITGATDFWRPPFGAEPDAMPASALPAAVSAAAVVKIDRKFPPPPALPTHFALPGTTAIRLEPPTAVGGRALDLFDHFFLNRPLNAPSLADLLQPVLKAEAHNPEPPFDVRGMPASQSMIDGFVGVLYGSEVTLPDDTLLFRYSRDESGFSIDVGPTFWEVGSPPDASFADTWGSNWLIVTTAKELREKGDVSFHADLNTLAPRGSSMNAVAVINKIYWPALPGLRAPIAQREQLIAEARRHYGAR